MRAIRRKDEEIELIPESEAIFFHVGNNGTTAIRFELGEGDAKDQIVITPPLGGPVRGVRVE